MQSLTARSPICGLRCGANLSNRRTSNGHLRISQFCRENVHYRRSRSAPLRHTAHTRVLCKLATDLSFRVATPSDASAIRSLILKESMNPLGLVPERFTVAVSADGTLLGFGQLEQKDSYVELRSMIVEPSVRGQGVGRALLKELLGRAGSSDVLLTTIGSRMRFYQNEGFHRLSLKEVPRSLLFEVLAGTVVARIAAGDELVVMKRTLERR